MNICSTRLTEVMIIEYDRKITEDKECRHARYKTALHGNYRLTKKLSGYVKGEEV